MQTEVQILKPDKFKFKITMYTLIKENGVHDSAVSDNYYHGLGETSRRLYEYAGADKEGPEPDKINADVDRRATESQINPHPNAGQEQKYGSEGERLKKAPKGADKPAAQPVESRLELSDEAKLAQVAVAPKVEDPKANVEAEPKTFEHVLTQEDVDDNPDFGVEGLNVGDTVSFTKEPDYSEAKEEADHKDQL